MVGNGVLKQVGAQMGNIFYKLAQKTALGMVWSYDLFWLFFDLPSFLGTL